MTSKSMTGRLDLNTCTCTARVLTCAGRYLLILSALSLLTMPITEHLWTWDRFLQTGRDFELTTLMVLVFLCLVLVLSKQLKQSVDSFQSLCHDLICQFADDMKPEIGLPTLACFFDPEPGTSTGTGSCEFPLQI